MKQALKVQDNQVKKTIEPESTQNKGKNTQAIANPIDVVLEKQRKSVISESKQAKGKEDPKVRSVDKKLFKPSSRSSRRSLPS